jgi:2,3,4,5-tetrahydropyridine-2-carboxylate N-succinyltransferase
MTTATTYAYGVGIGTRSAAGRWLEVYYPLPVLRPDAAVHAALDAVLPAAPDAVRAVDAGPPLLEALAAALDGAGAGDQAAVARRLAAARAATVVTVLAADVAVAGCADAYLKLHLLSHRLVRPNGLNVDGIFAALPNVAWTSDGPIAADEVNARILDARIAGRHLHVHAVDKFPRMTDYVVPSGVRLGDAIRVRLGAYLGEGTTVMHEGFANFNAGAIGPNLIEGRISAGVTIGAHSDLGGSASTMGTLWSAGKGIVVSVGEHCLIGANAGTGIPLGDNCTIEAGLYVTAGTVVDVVDAAGTCLRTVKARELAGADSLLFIRNGRNGRIEARPNRKAQQLNTALHAND